jgi:large subunit ribosomal protein L15
MSMGLSDLHPAPGSRPSRKRLGRGHGSGRGKTAGKGTKGQKARAGASIPAYFEGGQNSLVHRMPTKRGERFRQPQHKPRPAIVNLRDLDRFAAGTVVDRALLQAAGLVDDRAPFLKILGTGELDHALEVHAEHFSGGARTKIEAIGGQAIVIGGTKTEEV